jgi:hypothetical protein
MTDAEYYAIHRYDPQQSSLLNWGATYSDQVLQYGQIKVTLATCLAGGIASLKVAGREFIASGGHGAGLGICTHPTDPPSECYNPTENGNKADDRRDSAGAPPQPAADSPLLNPQCHGPSTSAIWQDATYWRTSTLPNGQRRFRGYNRMAYYVPGWGGYTGWGECTPQYPNTLAASYGLSAHILDKEVRLGPWRGVSGEVIAQGYPFLGFRLRLTIEGDEPVRPQFDLVLIAYLLKEFTLNTMPWETLNHESIIHTPDGWAFGFAPEPQVGASGGVPAYGSPALWDKAWGQSDPLTTDRVTTTQVSWYAHGVAPGVIEYRAYAVAGGLPCVQSVLGVLRGGVVPWWE